MGFWQHAKRGWQNQVQNSTEILGIKTAQLIQSPGNATLNSTLIEVYYIFEFKSQKGPNSPSSFYKWTENNLGGQVIP